MSSRNILSAMLREEEKEDREQREEGREKEK
jgi:hypothetical protein